MVLLEVESHAVTGITITTTQRLQESLLMIVVGIIETYSYDVYIVAITANTYTYTKS